MSRFTHQSGSVLIMVLFILFILMLLAVNSFEVSVMQLKMVNYFSQSMSSSVSPKVIIRKKT